MLGEVSFLPEELDPESASPDFTIPFSLPHSWLGAVDLCLHSVCPLPAVQGDTSLSGELVSTAQGFASFFSQLPRKPCVGVTLLPRVRADEAASRKS